METKFSFLISVMILWLFSLSIVNAATTINWITPIIDYEFKDGRKPVSPPNCVESPAEVIFQEEYQISWCGVDGASDYKLYENNALLVYSGPKTSYLIKNNEGNYNYQVQACVNDICSVLGAITTTIVDQVAIPSSTNNVTFPETIYEIAEYTMQWQASTGLVSYYEVEQWINGESVIHKIVQKDDNTPLATNYLLSLHEGNYDFIVRACNSSGCSDNSDVQSITIEQALVGDLYLSNPVNSQNIPQSTDLTFNLNWPDNPEVAQYQLSYKYHDLTLSSKTVHQQIDVSDIVNSELNAAVVTLPDDSANGLVTFYLTEYIAGKPTTTRKVVGKLYRVLASPIINAFGANNTNDTSFTASWTSVALADNYTLEAIFYRDGKKTTIYIYNINGTSKGFNIATYGGLPDDDQKITLYVIAQKANGALQQSWKGLPAEVAWRTENTGGTRPVITSFTPENNTSIGIDDAFILTATAEDDGYIDKVIFEVTGENINQMKIVENPPFIADFTSSFNGSMFGQYNLKATAYDNYLKIASEYRVVTRNAASINSPIVETISQQNDGKYNIQWRGSDSALVNHLFKVSTKARSLINSPYINDISKSVTLTPSNNENDFYYIQSCYGAGVSCLPRAYSDYFQLNLQATIPPEIPTLSLESLPDRTGSFTLSIGARTDFVTLSLFEKMDVDTDVLLLTDISQTEIPLASNVIGEHYYYLQACNTAGCVQSLPVKVSVWGNSIIIHTDLLGTAIETSTSN
ncbi:hypothetical protein [Colwellia sp. E150_009]